MNLAQSQSDPSRVQATQALLHGLFLAPTPTLLGLHPSWPLFWQKETYQKACHGNYSRTWLGDIQENSENIKKFSEKEKCKNLTKITSVFDLKIDVSYPQTEYYMNYKMYKIRV